MGRSDKLSVWTSIFFSQIQFVQFEVLSCILIKMKTFPAKLTVNVKELYRKYYPKWAISFMSSAMSSLYPGCSQRKRKIS